MPIKPLITRLTSSDLDSKQRCFQHTRTRRKVLDFAAVAVALAVVDTAAAGILLAYMLVAVDKAAVDKLVVDRLGIHRMVEDNLVDTHQTVGIPGTVGLGQGIQG